MNNPKPSFSPDDRMRSLIDANNQLLMVASRFGIAFGFGDKTVIQVCEDDSVDYRSFLAVCNLIDGRDYSIYPVSLTSMMEYLRKAHTYFLDFLLPSIRHKLIDSLNSSSIEDVDILLLRFFDDYVAEVRRHMTYENDRIFSYVDRLLNGEAGDDFRISDYSGSHTSMADKLSELKEVFIRHYHHKDTMILASALNDIMMCHEDLCSHCEVEDRIFMPAVENLERSMQLKMRTSQPDSTTENKESDESLAGMTERELDVIRCVAEGLSNKEIADRLCLSVHTITTYRRNISSKLGIHSPAGLTIFAILHNLVDINSLSIKD
ncbi:MAG: LuxR C-terminal-related transcriptional regulator [Muribaculaceae bacterium]|nr:LuxR C-terminal-related transcriptional regulator [Muribaculaceae bacterium]